MMPPVGSWAGGLVRLFEPSPPSLPAAHTITTPSLTSWRCSLTVAEFASNLPPPCGPYELLTTLIGGHFEAGTVSPHGFAWCSSTQFKDESALTITTAAPVDNDTMSAPGAAPDTVVPSLSVTLRPAAMLATWLPWPPRDSVSVSTPSG